DVAVRVPLGTVVSDADSRRELGEVVAHGQRLLVAKGGDGGAGNVHFKSSVHQAPEECKPGKPGEDVRLRLDLKVLADAGLVGFPSAGKSSILREISRARPKVAAYHFTTLHPIMGTVEAPGSFARFRVADIPGIVEGAHEGVGLGDAFLRHVERARVLVLVVDVGAEEGRDPAADHATLLRELEARDPALLERPRVVVASKMDLPGAKERLREFKKATGVSPIEVSVPEKRGFDKLVARLVRILKPDPVPAGRTALAMAPASEHSDARPGAVLGSAAPRPRRRGAPAGGARARKTGREESPGRTPPRPIEGRGEHPHDPADVSAERLATLGSFLRR
ncbi:MAG: 50S ribosome-binding GTPase, partial [Kiritimatiellae bacterium]|nr:50S ribosome-binding GTPase [Kiritimatiellia bacterium]